jgi:choline dehydrogenase-like flavoprotein
MTRQYPDDALPEGSVVDGEALTGDITLAFDFVVVGSGAAGAVAAHALASAGHAVAIVEEGPWVKTREFREDIYTSFKRMMRGAGTQVLRGRSFMPLLQGRCVGGSTVVNSAIAWRLPEDVVDDWSSRFGLGEVISMAALEPHFDALERDLQVASVADGVLGNNNRLFLEQSERSGVVSAPMRRYDGGCEGSGRCITGCPSAAKQGMNVSYVPWALALGARIFTSCRVQKVLVRAGRAVGVLARSSPSEPGRSANVRVELLARRGVVVAASTIQTPNILYRSGLRARALGAHFQAHPGLAIGGVFDRPIAMNQGATQGAESIHFRRTERFKLETIAMQPELAAARIPGVGADLLGRLASLGNLAVWAAQVRARAEGTVRPGWGGGDKVTFSLEEDDVRATRRALVAIAELLFDAGAREIWPGVFGLPQTMRSRDEVKLLAEGPLDARAYSFIATHLFGAARMGKDSRTSVVGPGFDTHEVHGLYVVDSSLFPTNLGVNPQHSIMAVARLAATQIAARPLPRTHIAAA